MNNVYFACTDCKTYADAGYRWAYCLLEKPRIVFRSAVVQVDRLLSADTYWKPEPNEQNEWLSSVLSHAEQFISRHKTHRIVYGDLEQVMGAEADECSQFAWMDEYPADDSDLRPRNFIEQLGMRTWADVTAYLASRPRKPWWYTLRSARVVARRKFDELILSASHSSARARSRL
jgi:hypothetical protein